MKVEGKVVVVTGGGSGIGAALARRFAAEGAAAVVVADRDLDAARPVAADCGAAGHDERLGVRDGAATESLVAENVRRRSNAYSQDASSSKCRAIMSCSTRPTTTSSGSMR